MTQVRLSTALVAEFIGTFALVFIGAGAGALGIGLVGVALAHSCRGDFVDCSPQVHSSRIVSQTLAFRVAIVFNLRSRVPRRTLPIDESVIFPRLACRFIHPIIRICQKRLVNCPAGYRYVAARLVRFISYM